MPMGRDEATPEIFIFIFYEAKMMEWLVVLRLPSVRENGKAVEWKGRVFTCVSTLDLGI